MPISECDVMWHKWMNAFLYILYKMMCFIATQTDNISGTQIIWGFINWLVLISTVLVSLKNYLFFSFTHAVWLINYACNKHKK